MNWSNLFKLGPILAIAILISGCSDAGQDNRNKYDACVTNWLKKYGYDFVGYNGAADVRAESACSYLLK